MLERVLGVAAQRESWLLSGVSWQQPQVNHTMTSFWSGVHPCLAFVFSNRLVMASQKVLCKESTSCWVISLLGFFVTMSGAPIWWCVVHNIRLKSKWRGTYWEGPWVIHLDVELHPKGHERAHSTPHKGDSELVILLQPLPSPDERLRHIVAIVFSKSILRTEVSRKELSVGETECSQ